MNLIHAFKTGLAAALASLAYLGFGLNHGFWAVVSAVVVMQANIGGSFKASWARLLGTALGAFIGACLAALGNAIGPAGLRPGSTEWGGILAASFFAGLAVALTGVVCMALRLKDAFRLSGVTCAIVLLVFYDTPWHSAFERTLDVSIGIVVALGVTLFVLPSHARHRLAEKLGEVLAKVGELSVMLERAYLTRDYRVFEIAEKRDAMKACFRDARQLLAEAKTEPGYEESSSELFAQVERILGHVLSLDEAARSGDPVHGDAPVAREDELHKQVAAELMALAEAVVAGCDKVAAALQSRSKLPALPELEAALAKLNARLLELRSAGASRKLPLDEVTRFYMFVEALKALARDVAGTGTVAGA